MGIWSNLILAEEDSLLDFCSSNRKAHDQRCASLPNKLGRQIIKLSNLNKFYTNPSRWMVLGVLSLDSRSLISSRVKSFKRLVPKDICDLMMTDPVHRLRHRRMGVNDPEVWSWPRANPFLFTSLCPDRSCRGNDRRPLVCTRPSAIQERGAIKDLIHPTSHRKVFKTKQRLVQVSFTSVLPNFAIGMAGKSIIFNVTAPDFLYKHDYRRRKWTSRVFIDPVEDSQPHLHSMFLWTSQHSRYSILKAFSEIPRDYRIVLKWDLYTQLIPSERVRYT